MWRSLGLIESSTAWVTGCSPAPEIPWMVRASTSPDSEVATPQAIEARVKPANDASITGCLPKRLASQPDSGSDMAVATM